MISVNPAVVSAACEYSRGKQKWARSFLLLLKAPIYLRCDACIHLGKSKRKERRKWLLYSQTQMEYYNLPFLFILGFFILSAQFVWYFVSVGLPFWLCLLQSSSMLFHIIVSTVVSEVRLPLSNHGLTT